MQNRQLIARAIGLVGLLLLPAAVLYSAGEGQLARLLAIGAVLAFYLAILARPIAPFGVLIALLYGAAAVTANLTDGVAALIVAVAAATGAASSVGYHRGLLAVLAAVLIGSIEPADVGGAMPRVAVMFCGCIYGIALARTIGRPFTMRTLAVDSKTALGYAVLLAVLVIVAWYVARGAGLRQPWWVPLVIAALGEPWLEGTPVRAVSRLALALAATLGLLALCTAVPGAFVRGAFAGLLLVALLLADRRHASLQAFLLTPALMLLVAPRHGIPATEFAHPALLAFGAVAAFAVLGKWMLWTLRRDAGHVSV